MRGKSTNEEDVMAVAPIGAAEGRRRKIALVVSLIGAMAFILMLWSMTLPSQIAATSAYIAAKSLRWSAVGNDPQTQAQSLGAAVGAFNDGLQRELRAADDTTAVSGDDAQQKIDTLRVRIEAASLKQKIEEGGAK